MFGNVFIIDDRGVHTPTARVFLQLVDADRQGIVNISLQASHTANLFAKN
jgi:hypothetical protein